MLNPVGSEFSATFVGRLVTTLIQQMGSRLGEQLDMLLKAVLSKLQGAQTLTVAQSLIMVYAHLVHSQLEAVLSFLSSVPGPTGASALQFVLGEWVSKQQQFFGCYESKVFSSLAFYSHYYQTLKRDTVNLFYEHVYSSRSHASTVGEGPFPKI